MGVYYKIIVAYVYLQATILELSPTNPDTIYGDTRQINVINTLIFIYGHLVES